MKNRLIVSLLMAAVCLPAWAKMHSQKNLHFETFAVPGTPVGTAFLGVENINDLFQITGFVQIQYQEQYFGFTRGMNGKITDLNEPNTSAPPYTFAAGTNIWGVTAGYFWNTAENHFSGFYYRNGKYTTWEVPGLPAGSHTFIYAINDLGDIAGFYQLPGSPTFYPFVTRYGKMDTNFNIPGATLVYPVALNDLGQATGLWVDSNGTFHGYVRQVDGHIQTVDAPGAGPMGTELFGLNLCGWMSGHYWDSQNHEHGFVISPRGKFHSFDVPGAAKNLSGGGTGGGNINDEGAVAGHYDPANGGPDRGYVVQIPSNWR